MTCKHLMTLLSAFASIAVSAQNKELSFSEFKVSNARQNWSSAQPVNLRTFKMQGDRIELNIDQNYSLTVFHRTHLPNKGVVYLCKDQFKQDVTVMLIGSEKLFFYRGEKRYQVIFNAPMIPLSKQLYADAD